MFSICDLLLVEIPINEMSSEQSFYDSSAYLINRDDIIDIADSVGFAHNMIISNILNENPNIKDFSEERVLAIISAEVSAEGFYVPADSQELLQFSHSISNLSSHDMLEKARISYPSLQNEIELLRIYADTIAEIEEDSLPEYSEGFKSILNKSNIEQNSKNIVNTSISVAGNSKLLWKEELLK